MEIEVQNSIHTGFYGSTILNPSEEGSGLDDQYLDGIDDDIDKYIELNDLEITTEYDFDQYETEVTEQVNDLFIETVNDIIYYKYDVENLFKEKIAEELVSPKEYNYTTDRSFIKIKVHKTQFNSIIDKIFKDFKDEITQYLKDHHTSYDGFLSFYSNDYDEWFKKRHDLDCNELDSIFSVLIKTEGDAEEIFEKMFDICSEVFYNLDHKYEIYYPEDGFKTLTFQELKTAAAADPQVKEWKLANDPNQTKILNFL